VALAIWVFVVAAFVFRLGTLAISVRNEKRMKAEGAREFGRANSLVLGILHTAIYMAAIGEGWWRAVRVDAVSVAGMALYAIGAVGLVVVIRELGRLWSLKLLIARDHVLITHPLFRVMRHPNYFVGILPELVGFCLALHAWVTLAVGMPVYLVSLGLRIRLEEQVMRQEFAAY
jgi:isoprenylcysteine carboxyl methyltransferase (ICMT) family protein YpbQ